MALAHSWAVPVGLETAAMARERIVAVGLLTPSDLDRLGNSPQRCWLIDESPASALLQAIDDADREVRRERDQNESGGDQAKSA